ncbi:AbiJ-NTD4 domain-containing protein [Acinetobacter rongchengensis]|uniref:HEPN AbiJ-N-terminal domain-containing protein n=1 Tax=Acinetobacter rongchengensis TaxID=2419601 RepID=A0A3A8EZC5_9GAMM|nr:hypothetical protein [Acinetobacter rongchengensis]RKG38856.1 hypothetical protein D7V20_06185 [Acinetobacter rongchengensis]
MRFSERNGYKPIREIIQKNSINMDLKNALWNTIIVCIFNKYSYHFGARSRPIIGSNLESFFQLLFHSFFKKRIDQIPYSIEATIDDIDTLFFKKYQWYEIYDFIEACIEYFPFQDDKDSFNTLLNDCLQIENSAYRIINNKVTEITSEQEIKSIEEALQNTNPYSGVQQHLNQSLKLMSDRQNPDYRNSIKESISAVESICKIVTQDEKTTLGQALKIIENKYGLHEALKKSLSQLYGYTSDADGIRHAMLEESNLSYIDAKFMLVACTNFINYLIEKTK